MFTTLKKILMKKNTSSHSSTADQELTTHIAAGVLLLEAAHVDDECTEAEMEHVVTTLKVKFELDESYVNELLEKARIKRNDAVDLWEFTNHINQNFPKDERLKIMEDVWRIIHADGQLNQHEDHFAHKMANLLRLSHQELIDTKTQARE